MHVFRPIAETDLPALVALARSIQGGLTTLPADDAFLVDRIDESLRAFSPRVKKAGGEYYLFVLEDSATREIVGTSGIAARVGGYEPFYSYEKLTERFVHTPLGIARDVGVLRVKQVHQGPTEIGALYLRPDCRRAGLGRLLSLARFLFVATYPKRFDTTIIAELRGYLDQQGKSPFWEAVGRHFYGPDFFAADQLSGLGNKQFIADLMPRHPIYIPLLSPEVQAVIGKVHYETQAALALLQAEGFHETYEVDIFDAGPQVRATIADIRTVRQSRTAVVRELLSVPIEGPRFLLSTPRLDFRAVLGGIVETSSEIAIETSAAEALQIKVGDKLRISPAK